MTLVAGRVQSLHSLQRDHYGEDANMQGILKSGPRKPRGDRRVISPHVDREVGLNHRSDDGKRLVRFCETEDNDKGNKFERDFNNSENQDVIMFGNNMYFINNSDPNSAVRKLFPNSKLTPINPFLNRLNVKSTSQSHAQPTKSYEKPHNTSNEIKSKSDSEDAGGKSANLRKIDKNSLRRDLRKVPPETKPKPKLAKTIEPPTPLIERIKQLTCDNENTNDGKKPLKEPPIFSSSFGRNYTIAESKNPYISQEPKNYNQFQQATQDMPKQAKEGLNLMRYSQNVSQTRSLQPSEKKPQNHVKTNLSDEARRSFLSTLSQVNESEPGDRTSIASNSTTADTVYSLSDIEEVLTEEEKEIKDAFSQENKQDELELFVQQDAGRTERIRKRYSSTPKPENSFPVMFTNMNFSPTNQELKLPQFTSSNCNIKKDKPKFGSTIEILQQLQQQIETPYQLEGRRTACSNYSDSSIPISDALFCDGSSDGYEPVIPKLNVHRTCSLDSKNYEEIDNFPSAFSVPRTKSHEHPCLTHQESGPCVYHPTSTRYPGHLVGRGPSMGQSIYASSPDLHGYHQHQPIIPNRFSAYNNHSINARQLHPVLQKQYCKYPVNEVPPRPVEEGKVLTPPSRMHTYMNVPAAAPCYLMPPPYSKFNPTTSPLLYSGEFDYHSPHPQSSIYQNVPLPMNSHMMTMRRLCTERERGVPEGASSSHDSNEMHHFHPEDLYFSNTATIPKRPSLPHHYCVDV